MAKQKGKTYTVFYKLEERGDPNVTVSINGKTYLIPRGKTVEVPEIVKTELDRMETAQTALFHYREATRGIKGPNDRA